MKNLLRLCVLYLSCASCLSATALAAEDPSGFLPKLDSLLGHRDFAQAFQAGDAFQLTRVSCQQGLGSCSSLDARYLVQKADADTAQVATFIGTRPDPSGVHPVSRAQWNEISGNMARNLIREIESFGQKVTVNALKEAQVTVTVNGQPLTRPAYVLSFSATSSFGSMQVELTLAPDFRGPGQVVRKSQEDSLGTRITTELKACAFAH